jgi:hypothetical protein
VAQSVCWAGLRCCAVGGVTHGRARRAGRWVRQGGLGDGQLGPSPRVMNRFALYISLIL